jgi:hypothetical protein
MSDGTIVTIYSNSIALILLIGILGLSMKLRVKDKVEKGMFLSLVTLLIITSIFYLLWILKDDHILHCNMAGAVFIETAMEFALNTFAVNWFLYVDYRVYRSIGHIKRDIGFMLAPYVIVSILLIINTFTGIMLRFDDELISHETSLYIFVDLVRVLYFISSFVFLEIHRRKNKKLKFFSVRSFFIPTIFFTLLYYFTPFATVTLGVAIGLSLICVQLVNEQCYQDAETGFFNELYLEYLKDEIKANAYDPSGALMFFVSDEDLKGAAKLIDDQLPENCDTIRLEGGRILTLTHVKDRSPLHMLSEDVKMSFEEAGASIDIKYDLKKKKESGIEFLYRFLGKK